MWAWTLLTGTGRWAFWTPAATSCVRVASSRVTVMWPGSAAAAGTVAVCRGGSAMRAMMTASAPRTKPVSAQMRHPARRGSLKRLCGSGQVDTIRLLLLIAQHDRRHGVRAHISALATVAKHGAYQPFPPGKLLSSSQQWFSAASAASATTSVLPLARTAGYACAAGATMHLYPASVLVWEVTDVHVSLRHKESHSHGHHIHAARSAADLARSDPAERLGVRARDEARGMGAITRRAACSRGP